MEEIKMFKVSCPNPFKHVPGDEISKVIKAIDKSEATDKFYEWVEKKYHYTPEIIAVMDI